MVANVPQYYSPDYELDVKASNMDNANSADYLEKIKIQVIENLRRTAHAPSVQMTDVPRDPEGMDDDADAALDDEDEDTNKDQRRTQRHWDKYTDKGDEFSDSEDEEQNRTNGVYRQPDQPRRRNIMDYQNEHAASEDERPAAALRSSRRARRNGSHETSSTMGNGDTDLHGRTSAPRLDLAAGATPEVEDVEMRDEPSPDSASSSPQPADGPQGVTPPESPPTNVAAPTVPAPILDDVGNDAMDEGDTLEDPEVQKLEGLKEREQEDIAAEESTRTSG